MLNTVNGKELSDVFCSGDGRLYSYKGEFLLHQEIVKRSPSKVPAHLWTELDTTPADTLETRLDRFIRRVKAWRP